MMQYNLNQIVRLTTSLSIIALVVLMVLQHSGKVDANMVETGVSEISPEGRHVAVNVPLFYKLHLDTRGKGKGAKMAQSVLGGFVRVDKDVARGEDGKMHGPVKVKVAGITVYNNKQDPPAVSPEEPISPETPSIPDSTD